MAKDEARLEILLWRHADAEDGAVDSARGLTRRGREQAAEAAHWLKERLPGHYRLLVSPAKRAVQTAEALGLHGFETCMEVGLSANARGVLGAIGRHEDEEAVLVVGHQPTLGQVASLLLCGSARDWSFRKSAVWWFSRRPHETVLRAVFDPKLG